MSTLRMQIAETQITIRQIKADLADAKQAAQGAAVTAAGGFAAIGKNKEEREFALEQAVNDSPAVKRYGRDLLIAESKLTRLEAELSDEQAAEQRDRWTIRARFVDALERVQFPAADSFFSGGEIDRAMDEVSGEIMAIPPENWVSGAKWTTPGYTPARRSALAVDYPRGLSYDQIDQEADELFGDE